MKERTKTLLLTLIVLVLAAGTYYYTGKNKKESKNEEKVMNVSQQPQNTSSKNLTPTPTPTPELLKYDYIITEITEKEVRVRTTRGGKAFFPKDEEKIKVYRGEPGKAVEASLSDLKSGQKLRIKRIPGRLLEVYIIK